MLAPAPSTGNTDYIVTTHEMAEEVQHRRAVFFVDREFFVIVDDIYGATGEPVMNLHFHLTTGDSEATTVRRNSCGNRCGLFPPILPASPHGILGRQQHALPYFPRSGSGFCG